MTTRLRLFSGTVALTGVLSIFVASPACAQSGRQPGDRARTAFEVLAEVDKLLQADFGLEVAKLELASTKLLPNVECEGLLLAKYSLDTERMGPATQARLRRAEAGSAVLRFLVSKSKPSPTDFNDGQPAREVAEKTVQALLVMNKVDNQKQIDKQIEADTISDGCLTEPYQRALDTGEIMKNEFFAKYVQSNSDRIKALVTNVSLRELYDSTRVFKDRIEQARRANPNAVTARAKAHEIEAKTVTPELRRSRDQLNAELMKLPTALK